MAGETVDASIVFLPRFTTLVGPYHFTTAPLDVSKYAGAQFQFWCGPISNGAVTVYLEESLDAQTWVLGPSTPEGIALSADDTRFFSYGFRLRWFRLKVVLSGGTSSLVTCWAEGLLRGGGGGVWAVPKRGTPGMTGATTDAVSEAVMPPQPTTRVPSAGFGGKGAGAGGRVDMGFGSQFFIPTLSAMTADEKIAQEMALLAQAQANKK